MYEFHFWILFFLSRTLHHLLDKPSQYKPDPILQGHRMSEYQYHADQVLSCTLKSILYTAPHTAACSTGMNMDFLLILYFFAGCSTGSDDVTSAFLVHARFDIYFSSHFLSLIFLILFEAV